jgi:hypothetical protein
VERERAVLGLAVELKLPHVVNLPVKSGSVGLTATKVPVWVNVAWTRPSGKMVSCSTKFDLVVIS